MSDPMDRPPVDYGSDRYDYVELIGAPPGVAPHGQWWERMLAMPCPDCRANLFAKWAPDRLPYPWDVTIAHDDGCPRLRAIEEK
jgi:hypothetical protein